VADWRSYPPPPDYPWLEEAAAEARAASRKYWQKGGEADRKHPVIKAKWWKIPLADDPQKKLEASIRRMKGKPDERS